MVERRAMERIPINRAARLSFGRLVDEWDPSVRGARHQRPGSLHLHAVLHIRQRICAIVRRTFRNLHLPPHVEKETLCGVCFLLRRSSPKLANDVVRLDHQ